MLSVAKKKKNMIMLDREPYHLLKKRMWYLQLNLLLNQENTKTLKKLAELNELETTLGYPNTDSEITEQTGILQVIVNLFVDSFLKLFGRPFPVKSISYN